MKAKRPRLRKKPPIIRRIGSWLKRALAVVEDAGWESAGGVVVNDRNEVALIRQGRKWSFPKGRVDPGEAVTTAAKREVCEETGLRVRIAGYLGVVEGVRHLTHYFLMKVEGHAGVTDGEVDEVAFTRRAKARRLLKSKSDREVLRLAVQLLDRK